MRAKWQIALVLAMAVMAPLTANADIIQLQNGQKISGSMKRVGDQMVITADDGTKTVAKPADIAGVTLTATPEEQAAVGWSTFKSDVARADDLATVISLHTQFLANNPQSPHVAEVKESLAGYQQLGQQKPVKFRGRWVPSAQVPVLLQQWKDDAAPALAAYRAGNLNGALAAAKGALVRDAENSDALEIAGLAEMRMDHLSDAENYFQKLATAAPGTGLAWHNLSVIELLQNRQAQALGDFSRALEAMPGNRLLLDNIAGILANFSGDVNTAAYQSLARQFAQAESREQSTMAAEGLYRYGSTWISQALLARYTVRDAQLAQAMQQADELSNEPMDADSSARVNAYEQALRAVAQSRWAFVPRMMDLGEDQAPPPPVVLATPAPLPEMPVITAPPAPLPDTSQVTSIADGNDYSQPVDGGGVGAPGIPFSPGRNAWRDLRGDGRGPQPVQQQQQSPPVRQTEAPGEGWQPREPAVPSSPAPVQFAPSPPSIGGTGGGENSPGHSNDNGRK